MLPKRLLLYHISDMTVFSYSLLDKLSPFFIM